MYEEYDKGNMVGMAVAKSFGQGAKVSLTALPSFDNSPEPFAPPRCISMSVWRKLALG